MNNSLENKEYHLKSNKITLPLKILKIFNQKKSTIRLIFDPFKLKVIAKDNSVHAIDPVSMILIF